MEAISPARTDKGNCHRLSRQKGSGSRRGEKQGRELEGSAIPAIEPGETLDHCRLGATRLGITEDALEAWLGLLESGKDLAAEKGDEGSRQ